MTFNVLDQSPMRHGGTAAEALRESVELARIAEGLGYSRYWVAEHHNASSFAGTSPELLVALIAAGTSTIRVGSGGVMLSNYSALKVAEQFRLLSAFYPGRLDLGVGRAPGGDLLAADALSHPRGKADPKEFPRQVRDLLNFLRGEFADGHPFAQVQAQPGPPPPSPPEVWMLSSGSSGAKLAAELGLPLSFADFLGDSRRAGPAVVAQYRESFQPPQPHAAPRVSVALAVICAPSEEEARHIGLSRKFDLVAETYGVQGLLPPEDVPRVYSREEVRHHVEHWSQSFIEGTPGQIRDTITELARRYNTDDFLIVTNCYSFEYRVRSYELLSDAFGLRQVHGPQRREGAPPGRVAG
ncbi:MAG: LLM class flavin-dependent oxidoreductase [Acidobacteria bacterium]|nr:LLM class flavin-dependent oxidoreductase [Acidobacteriota bacterium]